jgi:hypothetical protein
MLLLLMNEFPGKEKRFVFQLFSGQADVPMLLCEAPKRPSVELTCVRLGLFERFF